MRGLLDIAATTWAHELEVVVCYDQVGGKYGVELFNFLNCYKLLAFHAYAVRRQLLAGT